MKSITLITSTVLLIIGAVISIGGSNYGIPFFSVAIVGYVFASCIPHKEKKEKENEYKPKL